MSAIPYHPLHDDLYRPGVGPTLFEPGMRPSVPLLCAECARLAYKAFDRDPAAAQELAEALARVGCGALERFSKGDSQAFLAATAAGVVVVAFRGTEPGTGDVLTDIEALLVPWPAGGHVHDGFARAFRLLWPDIEPRLVALAAPVLFTGHSLGAALATLAASAWAARTPTRLVTFGSPRVGDAAFVASCTVECQRYVDCCDAVTRLPPAGLAVGGIDIGFRHIGEDRPLFIDRDRTLRTDVSAAEIDRDRLAAREEYLLTWALRPGTVAIRDLAEHAPLNYVQPLLARDGAPSNAG